MVNPFPSYSDSTRKILNTNLGEFSFFLLNENIHAHMIMHTFRCSDDIPLYVIINHVRVTFSIVRLSSFYPFPHSTPILSDE